MKKIVSLLLLCLTLVMSCERDDICPEDLPTTPRLIIDFMDALNPESSKNVFGLRVEDADDDTRVLERFDDTTLSQLILPLKTTELSPGQFLTQYRIYESYNDFDDNGTPNDTTDDIALENPDVISISYTRTDIYVSRACGYKSIFENVQINIEADSNNWIQSAVSINENQIVADETATHFNLFH